MKIRNNKKNNSSVICAGLRYMCKYVAMYSWCRILWRRVSGRTLCESLEFSRRLRYAFHIGLKGRNSWHFFLGIAHSLLFRCQGKALPPQSTWHSKCWHGQRAIRKNNTFPIDTWPWHRYTTAGPHIRLILIVPRRCLFCVSVEVKLFRAFVHFDWDSSDGIIIQQTKHEIPNEMEPLCIHANTHTHCISYIRLCIQYM